MDSLHCRRQHLGPVHPDGGRVRKRPFSNGAKEVKKI
jgi:hypothetical protein